MIVGGLSKIRNPHGKNFKPAKWVVKLVFNNVMKSVSIDSGIKKALFLPFYEACCDGDSRRANNVIYEHFKNTDWDWPLFKKWECEFDRYNAWPPYFVDYVKYRDHDKYETERQLISFISLFISFKIYSLIRYHQGEDCAESSKGVYEYTWEAVAEDHNVISKQLADKFNRHELAELPPFFPGDSCRLKLNHTKVRRLSA
ncbi:MAG: hypothetical protein HIU83_14250 [Proteobacteria bacterium]|nr:hypothetical protein [Pseudomonadota bacterium]